jgi:hypothetical protein
MKNLIFLISFNLFFMGSVFIAIETKAVAVPDSIPKGWRASAINPPEFVIGTDTLVKHSGKASGFIQHAPTPIFARYTMFQSISADAYLNKRIRLTAYLKSGEVYFAGIYMNVIGVVEGADTVLKYANRNREQPIQETTDWTLFQITLDVPENSRSIGFGVWLFGQGTLWLDDFTLEEVDNSIPSDDWVIKGYWNRERSYIKKNFLPNATAMNLGFEEY